MDEDKVTKAIAAFLSRRGWTVHSINAPFSGRSIWIMPTDGKRGKGALIPDVLATKDGELIVVECSAPYKVSDESKLQRYLGPGYVSAVRTMFQSERLTAMRLGVGLPLTDEQRIRSRGLVVFAVTRSLKVTVRGDGVSHSIASQRGFGSRNRRNSEGSN